MDPLPAIIVVYSAQILFVVAAAAAAEALARPASPAMRLAFWRAVAAACLALPLLATVASPAMPVASVAFTTGQLSAVFSVQASTDAALAPGAILLWILAAGVLARLAWFAAGMLRLRSLRGHSTAMEPCDHLDDLRLAIAPEAEFRISPRVGQPATFGHHRPVILLPPSFEAMDAASQRAVVCHELLHVARRDWLWIAGEEMARVVFWFHPAIWWLLERMDLSREQLIDQLVTTRTASKQVYMRALLSFAGTAGRASLSTAFLRKRHLHSRLQHLGKESSMSRRRLASTAMALITVLATAAVVRALPLQIPAPGQAAAASRLEVRLAEREPGPGLSEAVVSGSGERLYLHAPVVTGADVASASVTADGQTVGVTFTAAAAVRLRTATQAHVGKPVAIVIDGRVASAPVLRDAIEGSAVITGLTAEQAKALAASLASAAQPPQAGGARSAGPSVVPPTVIRQTKPAYTREAMAARLQGTVTLSVVVLPDGSVGDVKVVKSLDTRYGLDEQAVAAAKEWRFRPGTRSGEPVPVQVILEMQFNIRDSPPQR